MHRPDPIQLLTAQDDGRLKHLLPIKYGRMVASPFAFLRGSAVVMAADLTATPVSGVDTILCGDAHVSNFGLFASPERNLLFDINDFDEAYPGPWEWDLKRLAASVVVAGRENGFSDKVCRQLVFSVSKTYQVAMERFAEMDALSMWYYHVDADDLMAHFQNAAAGSDKKSATKTVRKAQTRTQEQSLEKLTQVVDGQREIRSDPPLLMPWRDHFLDQILSEEERARLSEQHIQNTWTSYLSSLPDERRFLLQRYQIVDGALRVGGVGSVGTRCSIFLLEGETEGDAVILQLKEASSSCLEPYLPTSQNYKQHAQRTVTCQRLMQATSDMFLGWHTSELTETDYYWRQLKDMKGSFDLGKLDSDEFAAYVALCSWCLARAHARTGDRLVIHGYLGRNDSFAKAITKFAFTYADQTEEDHARLLAAVKSGLIPAETGI